MATEVALSPLGDWGKEAAGACVTPARTAGIVAWEVLVHSEGSGPDISRVSRLRRPKDLDAEDMWLFVYELITDAAEIGYVAAQVETSGFSLPWDGAKLRTGDLARAVAALLRVDVVEDDETFDPEYHEKMNAESAALYAKKQAETAA